MLIIGYIFRALEHHVFKEMGKTRATNLFTVGAHVVGHIHVHQWVGMILVKDYRQAIGQFVFGVRDGYTTVITFEFFDQRDTGG